MQRWDELVKKFSRTTDNLSVPIDTGIFETVVVLNALGIHTTGSCEGHLDHGKPYPWVNVESEEIVQLMAKYRELIAWDQQDTGDAKELRENISRLMLVEGLRIFKYLIAFYNVHQVDVDRLIVVRNMGLGCVRIWSQGGDFLELLLPSEREQKLREYQDEIRQFTAFLKSVYFGYHQEM
jgi:hypothetical protein